MEVSTDVVRSGGRLSPLMAKLRIKRATKALRGVRPGRVLDIGCGHFPLFLTGSGFTTKCGLDRDPGPGWRDLALRGRLYLTVADVQHTPELPFAEGTFDAVTMLAVVEHLDARTLEPLLVDTHRVLAEGGRIVLTTPPPWSDPVLRGLSKLGLASQTELDEHQAAYTPRSLRALLERAGFARTRAGLFELGLNVWATGDR